jgi:hypothetical protein
VAVLEDMLGCQTPPLDPILTRDQAIDLLDVDVKAGLVFVKKTLSHPARVAAHVARIQSVNEEVIE